MTFAATRSTLALLCLLVASAIASPVRAGEPAPSDDEWHEGVPPDASFRVRGPVPFTVLPSDGQAPTMQGVVATQPGAFGTPIKYVARCIAQPGDHRPDAARIEEAADFWRRQAAFAYQRDVRVGALAGIEFQLSDPGKTLRVRVLASPERVCTLFVQWNAAAKPRDAVIERFLGSFEPVAAPGKPGGPRSGKAGSAAH